ncbi:MAG: porin family protein [Hyphomicrobium sp.]|nr:porin family protein [Hyphomicrobium sp.]
MKVQIACVSLAALVAVAASSANAADFSVGSDGSIKDMSPAPAVAVPAPVPVPDFKPSWYFRLDAGIGTVSEPDFSESGYKYGHLYQNGDGYAGTFADGPTLQDLDPTWFTSDFSNLSTFGGGVGYYLGGGWRLDATVEKRSNDQAYINGSETWESNSYYDTDFDGFVDTYGTDARQDGDFDGDGSVADRLTTIHVTDRVDVDGTVWMANMYYDMSSYRGFTPYIGAGIGFVWNQLDRQHTTTITSCDAEVSCGGTRDVASYSTSDSADTISIAAAAMVGFSYDISEIAAVDVGYRYLYMGGTDFAMNIAGVESRVEIGDQNVHQLRAGLRFNVN